MSPRGLGRSALGALAILLGVILLVQLGARANRAADAVSAVRRDGRSVTVLFDRAAAASILGQGWEAPAAGQGALSNAGTAYVVMPTSTAAGDVELCLGLRPAAPDAGQRLVGVWVDTTAIGAVTPRAEGDKAECLIVPSAVRSRSYELVVLLDLVVGAPAPSPIRLVSASTRIRRSPAG